MTFAPTAVLWAGVEYPSGAALARELGVDSSNIVRALKRGHYRGRPLVRVDAVPKRTPEDDAARWAEHRAIEAYLAGIRTPVPSVSQRRWK